MNLSACTNGTSDGLCENGVCGPCQVPADDANCTAAYGQQDLCLAGVCTPGDCRTDGDCSTGQICGLATPNFCAPCATDAQCQADSGYGANTICIAGACTPGNCHSDATCNGQICGLTMPNFCGACTTDAQCQADPTYGAADICDTSAGSTQGTCVTGICKTADDVTCAANTSDVCCGLACVPGNCCDMPFCQKKFGNTYTCTNHTCTQCDTVGASKTYIVDPFKGNDATATGSGTSGGTANPACAFKTITRALQFLGAAPGKGTIVSVINDATVAAGETFPIVVTENVTIEGASATSQPTIVVPTNKTAFELAAASSGLLDLIINGMGATGTTGIVVTTGSALTTNITGVTVENMAGDGIDVIDNGIVTIGPGTISQTNGTATAVKSGLRITGNGQVTITVDSGQPAQFSKNTEHGIVVTGNGSVNIGTDAASLNPAVIAEGNNVANLYIQQTPGAPPLNQVSNFQGLNSVTTHGIHILGGSTLKLRNSVVSGNRLDGVFVTTLVTGANTSNNSVAGIDLGGVGSPGQNKLQFATGMNPNGGVGICLNLTPTAAQTLNAAGNTFEGFNCATGMTTLKHNDQCTGGDDVGISGKNTTNKITLTQCD